MRSSSLPLAALSALLLMISAASCTKYGIGGPRVDPDPKPGDSTSVFNAGGIVRCGGRGIPGVAVSDGYEIVLTGPDGRFGFNSDKRNGYVFISVPSGYEVPLKGILPQFYRYFTKPVGQAESFEFELNEADQSDCSVLFWGDMHLADRSTFDDIGQFGVFADEVNSYLKRSAGRPVYAVTLGDMSWDIFWPQLDLERYLALSGSFFGKRIGVYHTMGNHDNDDSYSSDFLAASTYRSVIGPNYYSFNIGGVHFVVLDDIEYRNGSSRSFYRELSREQSDWLVRDLALVPPDTPLVITMHAPLYYNDGSVCLYDGFKSLIRHLEGRRSLFVTGHTHVVYNVDRRSSSVSVYEHNSGAVCGAWWVSGSNSGIHLSSDGAPGGYRIMDIADGRIVSSTFKGTRIPAECQFRSYDRNSIRLSADIWTPDASEYGKAEFEKAAGEYVRASSDNKVLLNVWDYDPSWRIEVLENGRPLQLRQLDDVKDPLYLVCYEAYEYEHHYDNSVYYPSSETDHIFEVSASSPSSTLEITVTDDEGRSYRETMRRPRPFTIKEYLPHESE